MRGVRRSAILLGFAALSLAVIADTRQPASMAESLSTQEHVKQPGWWPTKGTPARGEYAGNAACAQCHAALVQSQQQHSMARAAMPGRDSEFLKNHVGAPFNVGANRYEISKDNSGDFRFAATDGSGTASGPITWAFGIGKVGQSYISEAEGKFRELRFSYFVDASVSARAAWGSLSAGLGIEGQQGCQAFPLLKPWQAAAERTAT